MGSAPAIRLAPYDGSWVGSRLLLHHILSRHDSYHSVGAAVDRVRDHPVDGRIVRPAPDHLAIVALGGQVQPMLDEPEQGLPDTAEFATLSKTRMTASWTRRSGSFSSLSPTFTKPTGAATMSSPPGPSHSGPTA